MTMIKFNKNQSGFALLIALVVVGVVVSVGLTILDLTIKQLSLSTNSKDSEIAFHAANAGLECAQYWRIKKADALENASEVSIDCFDSADSSSATVLSAPDLNRGNAHTYEYQFDWGSGTDVRCSKIKMLLLTSDNGSTGAELDNVSTYIPGFADTTDIFDCDAGGRCTLMSVQGYNKSCSSINTRGTLEREVLLES